MVSQNKVKEIVDDHGLYKVSRRNIFPVHLFCCILQFVLVFTRYVLPNKTMTIYKYQRSRLSFNLSDEVTPIGLSSIY